MGNFFPRQSVAWTLEEPPAFRRLTLSLVEMAVVTGVTLRLVRALALAYGGANWSWPLFGAYYTLLAVLLIGAATLHLGNFPVRQWAWRAPLFALVTAVAEALTSLALIALGREPLGTSALANFQDWPSMALWLTVWRLAQVCLFALVLAAVVQGVRTLLVRRAHREQLPHTHS